MCRKAITTCANYHAIEEFEIMACLEPQDFCLEMLKVPVYKVEKDKNCKLCHHPERQSGSIDSPRPLARSVSLQPDERRIALNELDHVNNHSQNGRGMKGNEKVETEDFKSPHEVQTQSVTSARVEDKASARLMPPEPNKRKRRSFKFWERKKNDKRASIIWPPAPWDIF